jgi:hypothetical protein
MVRKKGAILEPLLAKAISLGANQLEVEYNDRCEEVFAVKSGFGPRNRQLSQFQPRSEITP